VIRDTLATMSENQRLALALYHYEKLGPAGIAEALEISREQADRLLIAGSVQVIDALVRGPKPTC
jgi:DNA-directed RNA polymerase specialized sigma24 family protein